MKRAVICEGKTDAVLIGYFLSRTFGWRYIKPVPVQLPADRKNEELNWFEHPDRRGQEAVVWGAGGIDLIPEKLRHIVTRTRAERNPEYRFERIVLFFDRDQRDDAQCATLASEWIAQSGMILQNALALNRWGNGRTQLEKTPAEDHTMSLVAVVLPPENRGALETFLMDCLGNHSEVDRRVVEGANQLVTMLPREPYLTKRRYRPKAALGSVLSVLSPEWVFGELDQRLLAVEWERIFAVAAGYNVFREL